MRVPFVLETYFYPPDHHALASHPSSHTPSSLSAKQNSETPVLFLHGLLGQARNMRRFQHDLASYRPTLAMDLRNHGQSPHGTARLLDMAMDVHHTLTYYNISRVTLIGHSLGGKIAMLVALLYPQIVQSLLVLDIAPALTGHGMETLLYKMAQTPFPNKLETRNEADLWLATISDQEKIRQLLLQNLTIGSSPHWKIGLEELVKGLPDLQGWPAENFAAYQGPVSFLKGEYSPYIRPEHLPHIAQLFPHYSLDSLPRAGHWLQVDNPAAFISFMHNFVKQHG